MALAMKLLVTVAGVPTRQDGLFVVSYDPEPLSMDTPYDGGVLVTTDRIEDALHFKDIQEAREYWMQSPGLERPGGGLERPLTAWTIELVTVPERLTC